MVNQRDLIPKKGMDVHTRMAVCIDKTAALLFDYF